MHLLTRLSLKNRALIALVTIVIAVFGVLSTTNLKQELIPSVEFPAVVVASAYPGASPTVVSEDVSVPIEKAIQGIPGLEQTTATSSANSSMVTATFTYGTDVTTAEQKTSQAINRIKSQLPDSVDPTVMTGSVSDLPVLQLAVTGSQDMSALASKVDTIAVPDLTDIAGVRDVSVNGAPGERVVITVRQNDLLSRGLTTQSITTALEQNGVVIPGGQIDEGQSTLSISTGSKLTSVDDVKALPLISATPTTAAPEGEEQIAPPATTIADVADVQLAANPVTSISRVNGEPAMTLAITKLPDANTVEVSNRVKDALGGIEEKLGEGTTLTVVFDQAPFIEQSISSLATEGLLGLVFAVLVILVFLFSVPSTLVTAISIPTSLLVTFIGLEAADYSMNIITLGGLTIAIGRVVDDSIVVIENIKRHLTVGEDRAATILKAVKEVAGAITASTLTTVAVFLPIALVGNITGELFRPFALTVTMALLASLLVSLTIVPVLAYWFLRPERPSQKKRWDPNQSLQRLYQPIIRWALAHARWVIIGAVAVLVGTIALAPLMKTNFLSDSGQNTLSITQKLAPASSLQAQDEAARTVETALGEIGEITTTQVNFGSSSGSLEQAFMGGGASDITYSITTDESADQEKLQQTVRERLDSLDNVGDISVSSGGSGMSQSDILVSITATNENDLKAASEAVLQKVSGLPDVEQASSDLAEAAPFVEVKVNRQRAAEAGLSDVAVGGIVSQYMQPQDAGSMTIDEKSTKIFVESQNPPQNLDQLRGVEVPTSQGMVRLDELAQINQVNGPATITTEKGVRTGTVTITPSGDNLGQASAEVTKALDDAQLPQGAKATIGGVSSDQQEAFGQLGLALLAAILIVYIVMVATFKSLLQPVLLLISVPFAATGAILLQVATGIPLGVSSLIGVLMLIGIVVTNAIVLIDLVNQYREQGMTVRDAVIAGSTRRFRPIIMTALATVFALIPMAIGITGHGGFISQPLAIVVIGGLVSSTALTVVVLPVLYYLVENGRVRRKAKKMGAPIPDQPTPATSPLAQVVSPSHPEKPASGRRAAR